MKELNGVQLAKAYNPAKIPASAAGYYVTEKLDGNRCIAIYNGENWEFYSRNGKQLIVNFDMSTFNPARVYDGEIITAAMLTDRRATNFNALNGLIARQYGKKNSLVYAVFDIVDNSRPYFERRRELDSLQVSKNAIILPALKYFSTADELRENIPAELDRITAAGGEGLIINTGSAPYQNKRTKDLLKVKQNYNIDLQVIDIEEGRGQYAGAIGALKCKAITEDGREIITDVGTGFDDNTRRAWYNNPADIIGKVVEVKFFDFTQPIAACSNVYALRFPRFVRVRTDKTETSIY